MPDMPAAIASEAERLKCSPGELMTARWPTGYLIIRTDAYVKLPARKRALLSRYTPTDQ